jgi:hypothetical protein
MSGAVLDDAGYGSLWYGLEVTERSAQAERLRRSSDCRKSEHGPGGEHECAAGPGESSAAG